MFNHHFRLLSKIMGLTCLITICLLGSKTALFGVPATHAQSSTATLSGAIMDEQGAVIAGATVTVVNKATGTQRQTTTNSDGYFTVPLLPPQSLQGDGRASRIYDSADPGWVVAQRREMSDKLQFVAVLARCHLRGTATN